MRLATATTAALLLVLCLPLTAGAELAAWFAPSASKIMRDAKPARTPAWDLAAARNEDEACQLVLLSDEALAGVRVTVSELGHTRGKGSLRAAMNKVEYVPIKKENTPYPDPLPPLTDLDLSPNQAQPVWITVRVPASAAPGTYKGTVRVQSSAKSVELPLTVRVWDFALPATPSCVTAFGMEAGHIATQHQVKRDSTELRKLYRKYYEFMLDRKCSPYSVGVDIDSELAMKYLSDPRVTSFMIPYSADDETLRKSIKRVVDAGLLGKSYFYPIDEPARPEQIDELGKIAQRVRGIEPNARIVVPFDKNPPFDAKARMTDLMFGKVNVWCPGSWLWDDANVWFPERGKDTSLGATMDARRKAGDALWWYVCCNPGRPYANFWVDQSAATHRILFWQQKMKGVQGILYWNVCWWEPNWGCPDPWKGLTTVTQINPNIYGDGSLIYPGKQVGVDGPVSSVRLEVIRDGIEDFEYLTLADSRIGAGASAKYISRLARSLVDFDEDPAKIEQVRRELGDAIEKATIDARKRL